MAQTLDSLLSGSGYTVAQVGAMDRVRVNAYASEHGFSASDVDAFLAAGAPAPAPAPASEEPAANSGFGGRTQWEVLEERGMSPSRAGTPGFGIVSDSAAEEPGKYAAPLMASMADSLEQMSKANASMLKGEIPADVSAAVRRAAGESSMTRGVFGSSSRALSARDLGRTSDEVMKQGQERQKAINDSRLELGKTYEAVKKTNLSRNKEIIDMESNIASNNREAISLERQRIATNIQANVQILGYIERMVEAQQQLAVQASSNNIDPSGLMASFDGWLGQFSGKLNG